MGKAKSSYAARRVPTSANNSLIQLSQVEGIKGSERAYLEPLDKGRLSLGFAAFVAQRRKNAGFPLTPLVAQSIRPFSPLSLPFKPFKPLGSGACETSVL